MHISQEAGRERGREEGGGGLCISCYIQLFTVWSRYGGPHRKLHIPVPSPVVCSK